jgi:Icc-related predicted phosphoesterase
MRLVLLSDTHGKHEELDPLPEGDVLIHAGDFMRSGKSADEIIDFAHWFRSQPFPYRILVAGNHDLLMQTRQGYALAGYYLSHGMRYLRDRGTTISGLKVWGSPWTTRFMDWAFMSDRGPEMKKHWDLIPPDCDILITHGPPKKILDSSPHYGSDLGCEELRSAVLRVVPKLHVFGHIHAGHGQRYLDQTLCVNAAVVDENYRLAHSAQVVDI